MRPLSLDFIQPPRAVAAGWALLLGGGVLLLASLLLWQWLAGERQQLAAQRPREQPQAPAHDSPRPAAGAQEAAQLALQRLSAPLRRSWEPLLAGLEALPRADVAWLALAPDAHQGQLRIRAEARNLEAMLAFHRQLQQVPGLSDVALLNHQVLAEQPGRPVLFNLQARWEVSDGRF